MARAPFDQFAARVVRNGELRELLLSVEEAGIPMDQIRDTATDLMREENRNIPITPSLELATEETLAGHLRRLSSG
jgi:hypothetical protein